MIDSCRPSPLSSIRRLAVLWFALATSTAWPAAAPPAAPASAAALATAAAHADERARIAQERTAAEARYKSREQECRQRFIVTSCLDEAKAERRQALDRLRARQVVVDEARRHERADERRTELADKVAEDARRESDRAAQAAASAASSAASQPGRSIEPRRPQGTMSAASAASGGHDRSHSSTTGSGIKPRPQASKATRALDEATHRAAFEARKADAIEHRDQTIERTTKRMAQKSPAAPLPVPGASSAAVSRAASRP